MSKPDYAVRTFQVRDANSGLAFYRANTADGALTAFLLDALRGYAKVADDVRPSVRPSVLPASPPLPSKT